MTPAVIHIITCYYLSFNEVFAVEVPFRHDSLQQILVLFELARSLSDLLLPVKYLCFSNFYIIHFLLYLWKEEKSHL